MDPISHTRASWLIRSGASGPGAARDDEHGGGKWEQLPGIRPSPLGAPAWRRRRGLYLFPASSTQMIFLWSDPQTDTQPAEFDQETVAGLSQPRRVFTSDHQRVEDVRGSSREEIKDKGVVGGADSSRLGEKATAWY